MSRRKELTKRDIRHSDLYGYIRCLLKLGFQLDCHWHKSYHIRGSPYEYLRSYWRLCNGAERVLFKLSRHGYSLVIWRHHRERLRVNVICWSHLSQPLTKYFRLQSPPKIRNLRGNIIHGKNRKTKS
jgi:hypothetical protein